MDEERRLKNCKKVMVQVSTLKGREVWETEKLSLLLAVHSDRNLFYSFLHSGFHVLLTFVKSQKLFFDVFSS